MNYHNFYLIIMGVDNFMIFWISMWILWWSEWFWCLG